MREREYCASKARRAAWTLSPKPAMPSSMAGPSNATKVRPRIDKRGRRTAAGLRGCVAQYNSISFIAVNVLSAAWCPFEIIVPFLISSLTCIVSEVDVCLLDKVSVWERATMVAVFAGRI